MGRGDDEYIFSPYESELERRIERNKERKTPAVFGNKCESKKTGTFKRARFRKGSGYTTGSYRKAIEYACRRAELPADWNPNQLRHSAATDLRKKYGIEAASVVLGHSNLATTEIYAEKDRDKAKEIAKKAG
jgi:integrase